MSILLFFGSANTIQSILGTSTPSVKHLALVIRAFLVFAKNIEIMKMLIMIPFIKVGLKQEMKV